MRADRERCLKGFGWGAAFLGVVCATVATTFALDAPSVGAVVTLPFFAVVAFAWFGLLVLALPAALYLSLVPLVVAPLSPFLRWAAAAIESATAPLLFLVALGARPSVVWVLGGALAFACVAQLGARGSL